jgi:cytochrome c oxidase subunit 2
MEEMMNGNVDNLPKSGSKNILVVLALLVVAGFFYWSSLNGSKMGSDMSKELTTSSPTTTTATAMTEGDVKVFTLEAGSFYYKPNVINVKKGDKVKVITNSVDMMHDFVIDELKVKSVVAKAGSSAEVQFTADQVGSFEFYCSVGSHRKMGMVGTLVVTE